MNKKTCYLFIFLVFIMAMTVCAACSGQLPDLVPEEKLSVNIMPLSIATASSTENAIAFDEGEFVVAKETTLEPTLVPLASGPAVITVLTPVASGSVVYQNAKVAIDASNTKDGYVMVRFLAGGTAKIKVLITGSSGVTYTYNLKNSGAYEVFPLSDGSGNYTIAVYQNVTGTKYATAYSTTISVNLTDQFAPFLRPNQYVNFTSASKAVVYGAELVKSSPDVLSKVGVIYKYVIKNYTYNTKLAATVTSGYLPNLDAFFDKKSGICFDYAALMTAMLRSQNIPTKLVVGYTGKAYHAWISVYTEAGGWLDNVIFFNGAEWKLMDPTFASSSKSSESIMKYIGNGENYSAKYLY